MNTTELLIAALEDRLVQTGKDVQAAYAQYQQLRDTDLNRAEISLAIYNRLGDEYRHLLTQYDAHKN